MTRRMTARWLALGATAASLALWASPVLAADSTVTIQGFAFSEGTVTVNVGDTVTWSNKDGASHTATADDGSFDTEGISGGTSKSITFDTAGTFPYHCKIHSDMTATLVVEAAAASPSPAPSSSPAPAASGSGGTGGNSTPPATETVSAAPQASVGSDVLLGSALALLVAGAAVLALLALRLRPAEESDKDR